jgi:uncharacterized integral membrane protein
MLRKILNLLVVLPLAIVFVIFAVANRHFVTVSFDPFDANSPAFTLSLPLFIVILLSAIAGVIAGGMATWFRQRHWRRAARRHEAEALQAKREADYQRGRHDTPVYPGAMLGPPL